MATAASKTTKKTTKTTAKATTAKKPAASKDKKLNVLFVSGEAAPFAQTGGLGEVAGSLPAAVNKYGEDVNVSVILPLYECITREFRKDFEFICNIYVPVAWRSQYAGLFKYKYKGVTYYFIDNEYYFKRPSLYGYYDDGERFSCFNRAVLEFLPQLDNKPDILHCNDWHTGLVPVYYKLYYREKEGYDGIKTLFTIHNIEYQGKYSQSILEDVFGIPFSLGQSLSYDSCVNLMYAAMEYSDRVSTVSPTYANELEDAYYACGLSEVVRNIKYKFSGIINGIDTEVYNPAKNASLFANYSAKDMAKKAENKRGLQQMLNLPESADIPLLIVVSRLAKHKGADIMREAMKSVIKKDVQFVILGTGDLEYENFFSNMQAEYPAKMRMVVAFNPDMAQKMFGAGDIFLMPSRSEPCGLGQMMAMRYGAVPVVRRCGGLKDTVTEGDNGNGFNFTEYNAAELEAAIDRALNAYGSKEKWTEIMARDMNADYSWGASGKKYIELYREMMK